MAVHPIVSADYVEKTIENFTKLDASGNKRSMTKMAQRLGKEQPALLQFAAKFREDHGDVVGEAAVFYGTLVWAMFDKSQGKSPRLLKKNIDDAKLIVDEALEKVKGLDELPVHKKQSDELAKAQPHVYAKLEELIEEDVREKAMTEETANIIIKPTQVLVEAFNGAVSGVRPGERLGPIRRTEPKIGRNDPCPCGSGTKYKKCHGNAA